MSRRTPTSARSVAEHIPAGSRLATLIAAARRLEAIERLLPAVLGLGEAAGLRALRITPTTLTLGTDSPGRVYRLRYAQTSLLTALRSLPDLAGLERIEVRTLADGASTLPTGMPGVQRRPRSDRNAANGPPDGAALRAAAGDCADPRLRAVLERLAARARNARGG